MKLAVIGDEVSQELDDVLRLCAHHGFRGLEVRSAWNRAPLQLTRNDCRRIVHAVRAAGMEVAAFSTPALKSALPRTAAERARVREVLARSLERAAWLEAPLARVFSFYHEGTPDPLAAAAEMRSALDGCPPPAGCRLMVENGMRTNNPDARETVRLLEALGGVGPGVLWDPGNAWFSGWDRQPFADQYALLREHIVHVHVKDPIGGDRYTRLGDGEVDWPGIVNRLAADGFGGWVSLETHWRPNRVLTAAERDDPFGDGFSAGGYEASGQCMAVLASLARRAR